MSVNNRNTCTCRRNKWSAGIFNLAARNFSKNLKAFLFSFFFFAANIRNNIVYHIKRWNTRITCSRGCLQSSNNHALYRIASFNQSIKRHHVSLKRTVRLYCNKSFIPTVMFFLFSNNFKMICIYFWNKHRNIFCPTVCTCI